MPDYSSFVEVAGIVLDDPYEPDPVNAPGLYVGRVINKVLEVDRIRVFRRVEYGFRGYLTTRDGAYGFVAWVQTGPRVEQARRFTRHGFATIAEATAALIETSVRNAPLDHHAPC
ncbi:hypothetical protein [Coralloluteibacterium stylophorae]|uniref:Uncharacterized protein n=1 Tax=Coralloluteibacterium stylophorae TaxID=1776034 RepID=A0A8J7VZ69_9GAMM|nr:hypothetical protein [Coralloluteibacterium stylophorae]MBS7458846.1 hypothetical protein [Coralloluteibacterium stylophorae]